LQEQRARIRPKKPPPRKDLPQNASQQRSASVNFLPTAPTHLENPPTRTVLSGPFHLAKDSGNESAKVFPVDNLCNSVLNPFVGRSNHCFLRQRQTKTRESGIREA
jgi:hypothetical protein